MKRKVGYLIKRIYNRHTMRVNQMLEQYDLTDSQLNVLIPVFLSEERNKKINQRDIENHLNISNPTVTGILNRLESKGLIERTPCSKDHRIRYIHPTKKALAIDKEVRKTFDDYDRIMLRGFSEKEEMQLNQLLERILNNIKE